MFSIGLCAHYGILSEQIYKFFPKLMAYFLKKIIPDFLADNLAAKIIRHNTLTKTF